MGLWKFLRRKESPDLIDSIQEPLIAYKETGCCKSLKVQFLHSNLDFFQKTLMKTAKSKVSAFILILSQWNTAIRFLERLCDSTLLLDVVR